MSGGILSINEARKELGYPAIEGCDTPIIPYTDVAQNQVKNTANETNNEQVEDNNNNQDTNTNDGEGTKKPQGRN